jgi:NTP pyrophosphatase (non-canonical NTP hydrolase)
MKITQLPPPETSLPDDFVRCFTEMARLAHANSAGHGFWNVTDPKGVIFRLSRIALIHSELSECLEGIRKGLADDHLPHRSMEVAELADTVIRIFDYAGGYDLPLAEVILEKMAYNSRRPHMHGKSA